MRKVDQEYIIGIAIIVILVCVAKSGNIPLMTDGPRSASPRWWWSWSGTLSAPSRSSLRMWGPRRGSWGVRSGGRRAWCTRCCPGQVTDVTRVISNLFSGLLLTIWGEPRTPRKCLTRPPFASLRLTGASLFTLDVMVTFRIIARFKIIARSCTPLQLFDLLNTIYKTFDARWQYHNTQ